MKKTLIASAIAAATFSGAAMAEGMPTVYGNIQLAGYYEDIEDGANTSELVDNGSTIGFKHEHEIAPGLTAFFKAEMEFNADEKAKGNGLTDLDEAYIGVKGDFGKVWVGSDDSTYERAIDEIANYYEYGDLNIGGDYTTGEGDQIQYASPSFGGLQLHASVQYNGNTDGNPAVERSYPYQLAATYEMDALELAVAMDSNDGNADANNENTYGVRGSYTLGDLRLTAQYQDRKDSGDVWGVFGGYTMGANVFALSYEMASADNTDEEASTISAQALHNLSDNMYVYVEGYLTNYDDGTNDTDVSQAVVGAVYYF